MHLSRRARNQQNIRRKWVHQQRVATITDKCVGSSSRIQPPCPCFQPPRVSKLGCSVLGRRKIAGCVKHMTGAHEYLSAPLSEHGTLLVNSETTTTTTTSTTPPDVPRQRIVLSLANQGERPIRERRYVSSRESRGRLLNLWRIIITGDSCWPRLIELLRGFAAPIDDSHRPASVAFDSPRVKIRITRTRNRHLDEE